MSLFDTPQDIRKRREPYIGEMEAYLWILEAEDPKTRKAREIRSQDQDRRHSHRRRFAEIFGRLIRICPGKRKNCSLSTEFTRIPAFVAYPIAHPLRSKILLTR